MKSFNGDKFYVRKKNIKYEYYLFLLGISFYIVLMDKYFYKIYLFCKYFYKNIIFVYVYVRYVWWYVWLFFYKYYIVIDKVFGN